MPGISLTFTRTGPLFADFAGEMTKVAEAITDELGDKGTELVLARLPEVLQNPTGYYQSQITNQRTTTGQVVTDQNVIYGPWLEGVGSRNAPVTSFAGYFTFRQVTQELGRLAPEIAERHLNEALS
jgi:hypothetical protein